MKAPELSWSLFPPAERMEGGQTRRIQKESCPLCTKKPRECIRVIQSNDLASCFQGKYSWLSSKTLALKSQVTQLSNALGRSEQELAQNVIVQPSSTLDFVQSAKLKLIQSWNGSSASKPPFIKSLMFYIWLNSLWYCICSAFIRHLAAAIYHTFTDINRVGQSNFHTIMIHEFSYSDDIFIYTVIWPSGATETQTSKQTQQEGKTLHPNIDLNIKASSYFSLIWCNFFCDRSL